MTTFYFTRQSPHHTRNPWLQYGRIQDESLVQLNMVQAVFGWNWGPVDIVQGSSDWPGMRAEGIVQFKVDNNDGCFSLVHDQTLQAKIEEHLAGQGYARRPEHADQRVADAVRADMEDASTEELEAAGELFDYQRRAAAEVAARLQCNPAVVVQPGIGKSGGR